MISPIPQFDQIPSHVLRSERVNDTPLTVDETISIRQEPYYLRSAVFLETFNETNADRGIDQIVISTGAIIRKSNNTVTGDFWVYSPRLANSESGKAEQLMQRLYYNNPESDDPIDLLSSKATIFIYAKNFNA